MRTPGAIVSRRPWSYAYATTTAAPAATRRNPSTKNGSRLLRERRRVWRRPAGARRSRTVAFTLTGGHTRAGNHANPVADAPRVVRATTGDGGGMKTSTHPGPPTPLRGATQNPPAG